MTNMDTSVRPSPVVAVLMGSDSDLPIIKEACNVLDELAIPCQVRVLSAHRCPDDLVAFVRQAENAGVKVFIAAAGVAAHLAGVVAAHTTRPVIGIPIQSGALNGLDALLSTVQMPPGVPVATMAIGPAGARNAALFAAEILALGDSALADKLNRLRSDQAEQVRQKDLRVQNEIQAGKART